VAFSDETADLISRDQRATTELDQSEFASVAQVVKMAAGDAEQFGGLTHRVADPVQIHTCHCGAMVAGPMRFVKNRRVLYGCSMTDGKTIEQMIGGKIRAKRKALDLTQEDLGAALGDYLEKPWPRQAVYEAERGMRQFRAVELVALAEVLGISPGSLVSSPGEPIELPSGKRFDPPTAGSSADLSERVGLLQDALVRVDELQNVIDEALGEMRKAIQLGLMGEGE
jgi:transcriptional regulator with XRE-family HTH domain